MTPRVESKSNELVSIFHDQSGWNLVIMLSSYLKRTSVKLISKRETGDRFQDRGFSEVVKISL